MTREQLLVFTRMVASKLGERGWTKGIFSNLSGEMCLVGAALNVSLESVWFSYGVSSARWGESFANHLGLSGFSALVEWNDARERTLDQVLAALNGYAASLVE